MGFISNLFSATVKTVITPIAMIKDAVNVASGEEADETKDLIQSAIDDAKDAAEDLADGDI